MKKTKRYSGVLVKCKDEVLLCKRSSDGSLPGQWSIPAGNLNENESAVDGARREFFEETDIKIFGKLEIIGFINRKNRIGSKTKGLMHVFLWEVDKKQYPNLENAVDGEEHSECGYFNLSNLPLDESDQLYKVIQNVLTK